MKNDPTLVVVLAMPTFALIGAAFSAVNSGAFTLDAAWLADRARLAAACAAATGFCVLVAIQVIATSRLVSDADRPGAGLAPPPGPGLRIRLAVLQNTLEQAFVASLAYFAFAFTAPEHELALLPLFAALFVVGRIAFAIGYPFGAPARAFGFALTYAPTVTLYLMVGSGVFGAS